MLSEAVMNMSEELWCQRLAELSALVKGRAFNRDRSPADRAYVPSTQGGGLREWMQHQKGLYVLGTTGHALISNQFPLPSKTQKTWP